LTRWSRTKTAEQILECLDQLLQRTTGAGQQVIYPDDGEGQFLDVRTVPTMWNRYRR